MAQTALQMFLNNARRRSPGETNYSPLGAYAGPVAPDIETGLTPNQQALMGGSDTAGGGGTAASALGVAGAADVGLRAVTDKGLYETVTGSPFSLSKMLGDSAPTSAAQGDTLAAGFEGGVGDPSAFFEAGGGVPSAGAGLTSTGLFASGPFAGAPVAGAGAPSLFGAGTAPAATAAAPAAGAGAAAMGAAFAAAPLLAASYFGPKNRAANDPVRNRAKWFPQYRDWLVSDPERLATQVYGTPRSLDLVEAMGTGRFANEGLDAFNPAEAAAFAEQQPALRRAAKDSARIRQIGDMGFNRDMSLPTGPAPGLNELFDLTEARREATGGRIPPTRALDEWNVPMELQRRTPSPMMMDR